MLNEISTVIGLVIASEILSSNLIGNVLPTVLVYNYQCMDLKEL